MGQKTVGFYNILPAVGIRDGRVSTVASGANYCMHRTMAPLSVDHARENDRSNCLLV